MINYDTVLSTFDDKLTLLQWLQKVEQALEGAGLERVEISQPTPTTAIFKFVFADGTSVTTPSVTLPRGAKGDTGATGATGATGNGIASITKTGTSGLIDTYTILYTNGSTQTFSVTNGADGQDGADGADGNGIASIEKTSTVGLVDTYTITYTDGDTDTFTVTNGADGEFDEVVITGASGTFTVAEMTKIANRESTVIVLESGTTRFTQYYDRENGTKYYFSGSYYTGGVAPTIVYNTIEITKATGAYTFVTYNKPVTKNAIDSESATSGQVLTADGSGGASWQSPSGTTLNRYTKSSPTWKDIFDIVTKSKGHVYGLLTFKNSDNIEFFIPISCYDLYMDTYPRLEFCSGYFNSGNFIIMGRIEFQGYGDYLISTYTLKQIDASQTVSDVSSITYLANKTTIVYYNDTQLV